MLVVGITDLVISTNTSGRRWLVAISAGQKKPFFRGTGVASGSDTSAMGVEEGRDVRNRMCFVHSGLLDKRVPGGWGRVAGDYRKPSSHFASHNDAIKTRCNFTYTR